MFTDKVQKMIDKRNKANDRIFVSENASLDEIEQRHEYLKSKVIEIVDSVRLNHAYYLDDEVLENASYEEIIKTRVTEDEGCIEEYRFEMSDEDYVDILDSTEIGEEYYDEFCELYRLRAYVFYRLFSRDKSNYDRMDGVESSISYDMIYHRVDDVAFEFDLLHHVQESYSLSKEKLNETDRRIICDFDIRKKTMMTLLKFVRGFNFTSPIELKLSGDWFHRSNTDVELKTNKDELSDLIFASEERWKECMNKRRREVA